jgi:hypothetical protein
VVEQEHIVNVLYHTAQVLSVSLSLPPALGSKKDLSRDLNAHPCMSTYCGSSGTVRGMKMITCRTQYKSYTDENTHIHVLLPDHRVPQVPSTVLQYSKAMLAPWDSLIRAAFL